jgi:hypothetical protein
MVENIKEQCAAFLHTKGLDAILEDKHDFTHLFPVADIWSRDCCSGETCTLHNFHMQDTLEPCPHRSSVNYQVEQWLEHR